MSKIEYLNIVNKINNSLRKFNSEYFDKNINISVLCEIDIFYNIYHKKIISNKTYYQFNLYPGYLDDAFHEMDLFDYREYIRCLNNSCDLDIETSHLDQEKIKNLAYYQEYETIKKDIEVIKLFISEINNIFDRKTKISDIL